MDGELLIYFSAIQIPFDWITHRTDAAVARVVRPIAVVRRQEEVAGGGGARRGGRRAHAGTVRGTCQRCSRVPSSAGRERRGVAW